MDSPVYTLPKAIDYYDVLHLATAMDAFNRTSFDENSLSIERNRDDVNRHRLLLTFSGLSDEKYHTVTRGDASDDDILVALLRLPPEYGKLRDAIIDNLGLPKPTQAHRDTITAEDRGRLIRLMLVKSARRLPKIKSDDSIPIDREKARHVGQSSYDVLKPDDKEDMLLTPGIAPCIAVSMENKADGTLALAHLADTRDLPMLEQMRQKMGAKQGDPIEVKIWGGRQGISEYLAGHIMEYAHDHDFTLASGDVCDPAREGSDGLTMFAIARGGAVRLATSLEYAQSAPPDYDIPESLMRELHGIKPTSIKPTSDNLNREDRGRGRGKGGTPPS